VTLLLEARDLSFGYTAERMLFEHLDLELEEGEAIGIAGVSGCGKSSLCQCLCGIIPHIKSGERRGGVYLKGQELADLRLCEIAVSVGMVFQEPEQQFFSPVLEANLAFGPENICLPRQQIGERISGALEFSRLEQYRLAHPRQLSGGQQQLGALSCILTLQPQVLIFDEAASQLDEDGCQLLDETIGRLKEQGKALIIVDHHMKRLHHADKILYLREGGWELK